MSVRVRYKVAIMASIDDDENQCQFSRPDSTLSEVIETHEVSASGTIELTASEVDHPLPLGDVVGGRILYVEVNGDVSIKLDGEAVGHKLGAPATGTKAKLMLRSEFTAAPLITNNGLTAIEVAYFLAGSK